jgi:hypothetical protein
LPSPQTCCPGITDADQPSVERVLPRGQLLPDGLERPPKPMA